MGKGGVKNPEKMTTSFMDALYVNMCLNARINSNTYVFEVRKFIRMIQGVSTHVESF